MAIDYIKALKQELEDTKLRLKVAESQLQQGQPRQLLQQPQHQQANSNEDRAMDDVAEPPASKHEQEQTDSRRDSVMKPDGGAEHLSLTIEADG